jgi:tRNA splicing ligase
MVKAVRHKDYDNLVLLKYSMIDSPMGDPLVQQCRGIILDEANNWNIVSYPYNKFFNHGEGHAADIDWSTARAYEKLDGSIMTMYYYDGQWHVASNGSPDAGGDLPHNRNKTFKQMFWQTFAELGYKLPKAPNTNLCFMFELMTPENRVVIPHKTNKLVLHGVRSVEAKFSYRELDPIRVGKCFGFDSVKIHDLYGIDDVVEMAKTLNGMESEGFVVCDENFNRLKIKGKSYVAFHHLKSSLSVTRLVEIVQSNDGSEFLRYFPEYHDEFWDIKDKFRLLCEEAEAEYAKYKDIETQKDFAIAVKDLPYAAAMFTTRAGKTGDPTTWFMNHDPKRVIQLLGLKTGQGQSFFRHPASEIE